MGLTLVFQRPGQSFEPVESKIGYAPAGSPIRYAVRMRSRICALKQQNHIVGDQGYLQQLGARIHFRARRQPVAAHAGADVHQNMNWRAFFLVPPTPRLPLPKHPQAWPTGYPLLPRVGPLPCPLCLSGLFRRRASVALVMIRKTNLLVSRSDGMDDAVQGRQGETFFYGGH